jgi:2,4'-dihydroxyacetophenone dioxygenase
LQLKAYSGVTVDRHTHAGEVRAYNVSGSRQLDTGAIYSWSCVGDEPCIAQITMSGRLTYLSANDELLDCIDTPKLRELYLAWCSENGFEPIAIGAAA